MRFDEYKMKLFPSCDVKIGNRMIDGSAYAHAMKDQNFDEQSLTETILTHYKDELSVEIRKILDRAYEKCPATDISFRLSEDSSVLFLSLENVIDSSFVDEVFTDLIEYFSAVELFWPEKPQTLFLSEKICALICDIETLNQLTDQLFDLLRDDVDVGGLYEDFHACFGTFTLSPNNFTLEIDKFPIKEEKKEQAKLLLNAITGKFNTERAKLPDLHFVDDGLTGQFGANASVEYRLQFGESTLV